MIPDLPHDLETEILSRVPATSLSQLLSTCKRWYALFKDPEFVKKNMTLGKAAREVILLMNSRVSSIILNLHGIHNTVDPSVVEFRGKLNCPQDIKISNISHCDGLMLCSTILNTRLVVWNPCTGETKWIKPRTSYKPDDRYFLGYENNDSSSHSYTILMFYGVYNGALDLHVAEYEIYDFSSDTWRVLDVAPHNWYICSLGVTLKGNVYGIAFGNETGYFMLKFDFATERFGCLSLPYQSYDPEDTSVLLSVVRDEQLSVLHQDFETSDEMKIWVTNKIDDEAKEVSWSKFFVVDLGIFKLPSMSSVMSFLVDEENKMVQYTMYDEQKIYIVGEDIHKELYKETKKGLICPLLVSYVPSLVQIQKKTHNGKRDETNEEG